MKVRIKDEIWYQIQLNDVSAIPYEDENGTGNKIHYRKDWFPSQVFEVVDMWPNTSFVRYGTINVARCHVVNYDWFEPVILPGELFKI